MKFELKIDDAAIAKSLEESILKKATYDVTNRLGPEIAAIVESAGRKYIRSPEFVGLVKVLCESLVREYATPIVSNKLKRALGKDPLRGVMDAAADAVEVTP